MVKHCVHGVCNADTRYPRSLLFECDGSHETVYFIPFPKPRRNPEKAQEWVKACGRPDFNVENIEEWTYICSKHFVGSKGPTLEYPNPIPANLSKIEYQNWLFKNKKRKPLQRSVVLGTESPSPEPPRKANAKQSTHLGLYQQFIIRVEQTDSPKVFCK